MTHPVAIYLALLAVVGAACVSIVGLTSLRVLHHPRVVSTDAPVVHVSWAGRPL